MESNEHASLARQFLAQSIETFEELEALLLVRRSAGGCDATLVATQLGIARREAAEVLARLVSRHLLEFRAAGAEWTFHFRPSSVELAESVQAVQRLYTDDHTKLVELMAKNAVDRVRGGVLRAFGRPR